MGRGRQKAKQVKLGRDMKYNQPEPDFAALSAELQGQRPTNADVPANDDDRTDDK